jgi:riboflavin synthase
MFTGLVEAKAVVREVERRGAGLMIRVALPGAGWEFRGGESVSVSGACLTVVEATTESWPAGGACFELSAETLARTWFGALEPGREVNLERALRIGDRLDGHLVSGHVDAVGRVVGARDSRDGGAVMEFEAPEGLERFLVDKGSITIDGVSLTVVNPRGRRFEVAVIPATLAKTTLGSTRAGAAVNLEADQLGKWIDRLLAARAQ